MTSIMKRNTSKGNSSLPMSTGSFIDQFFQNNLSRFFDDRMWGDKELGNVPVNIRETDKSYELELVAPGLKKEDFKLQMHGDLLTISFDHEETKSEGKEEDAYLRREYRHQSFSRSFHLDDNIDVNKVSAQYLDGMLHVSLPKKENAQRISRMVEVR